MIWRVNVIEACGLSREQLVEVLLVQLHQHRVAQCDDGGGSRLARVQAHLADDFTARHLAHHALRTVFVAHVNAQPPADAEIGGIAGRALLHQDFAAGEFDPLQMLLQKGERRGAARPAALSTAARAAHRDAAAVAASLVIRRAVISRRRAPPAARRSASARAMQAAN